MWSFKVGKLLSALFIAGLFITMNPIHATAAQQGCKKVCVKTEKKCIQKAKKCIATKRECVQTGKKCIATKTNCLQRNTKTGQCVSSQQVCSQYQEYCAQYRQACAQYQDVCSKYQDECVQYKDDCPQTQHRKMSCNECQVQRSRCTTGCGNINDLIKQSNCINRCNGAYSCVIGYDCN